MKKIILPFIVFIVAVSSLYSFVPKTIGETAVYYQSGELYFSYGKQILAAPNGREIDFLEIAKNDKLVKISEAKAVGSPYQALIKKDAEGTYAIVLEGDFIIYYDISDINNITVVKKVGPFWKDYDYYYDIAPYTENRFLTAGEKGITIWDANNLSILEKIYDKRTDSVESYNNSIYAIGEEGALIFNAERKKIRDSYIKTDIHQHQIYIDDIGTGYFPGDDVLKLRTYSSYKNMPNPSGAGNAVAGFKNSEFIYFANGWNVYKLTKDLKIIKTLHTTRKNGEWTAGLKALELSQGKRLIIFNGIDILLVDENLNILDEYNYRPYVSGGIQSCTMKISPAYGAAGNPVMVTASGLWPGETAILKFGSDSYFMEANNLGEIIKMVDAPNALPGKINISVSGKQSGIGHSFMFEVK